MAHAKKDSASVQELIEERGQINQWIERLQSATDKPEAVRNKVRAGYEKRLAEIAKELSGARKEIEDTLKRHKAAMAELQEQEQAAQEKLSEAEVRHSVGELDDAAWKKISHDVHALLDKVQEKLKVATDAVNRTGSALASLDPDATVAATKGAAPVATPVTGNVALQSKISEFVADPDPVVPTLSGKMQAHKPRESASPIEKPVTLEPEIAAAAPAAAAASPPTAGPPPKPKPKAPPPAGFDELAFIKSVSEDEKHGPAASRASGMARLSSTEPVVPDQKVIDAGGAPAPAPATTPKPASKPATPQRHSALNPAPVEAGTKTLKCKECGTMNPPTEWYCSSCGAELSQI